MIPDNSTFNTLFSRQILLPEIGAEGQAILACAHVAVVGVGAVGSRVAELLCRSGVGRLTIIDRDFVELSNLPRQTLYTWSDAQSSIAKVEAARRHLNQIMPTCCVYPKHASLSEVNVSELLRSMTVVADGTDNMETRYVINDWCVANDIPWVYAGAVGTRASVFPILGQGRCLRCVFPDPPRLEDVPTCDPAGVLGSATAIAAANSATTAIRIILGDYPESLWRTWDVWSGECSSIHIDKLKSSVSHPCPLCEAKSDCDSL
jgi:molybdopterin-synthase adenylyltransferase